MQTYSKACETLKLSRNNLRPILVNMLTNKVPILSVELMKFITMRNYNYFLLLSSKTVLNIMGLLINKNC